jgi:hypothetical protein
VWFDFLFDKGGDSLCESSVFGVEEGELSDQEIHICYAVLCP